ncbi:MAG TPA: hypothetical protein VFB99_17715, partial [Vicinamibacterales bacterium]|nr:hypothetical protein [Vicinamibacterales bacterium]
TSRLGVSRHGLCSGVGSRQRREDIVEKRLILQATETSNAVYLLDTYHGGAAFDVDGQRHYFTWDELEGLSTQADRETAAHYRAMLAARNAGSMGGSGSLTDQAESLIADARRHRDRGETAQAAQCIRTLDDLIGGWVDGVFVGGTELVRGRVSVETAMAVRFGPTDQAWREMLGARLRASPTAHKDQR